MFVLIIPLTSGEPLCLSTELVELKIEEFLASFGEKLDSLTEEAFNTQVCVCVCLCARCVFCVCNKFFFVMEKFEQMLDNIRALEMSKVALRVTSWWINNTTMKDRATHSDLLLHL